MTPDQQAAIKEAAGILVTEANELALYMEVTMKAKLTRDGNIVDIKSLTPHRAVIGIRNEVDRLRRIEETLRSLLPKE